MTDRLPPQLLQLFAPRPALRYLPPSDHAPEQRRTPQIEGVAQYLQAAKDYQDDYIPTESWLQKKDRQRLERDQAAQYRVTEGYKNEFNPREDPNIHGDPLRTLFVSRLSYTTEVKDLEREFGRYGPIERIRLVEDKRPEAKKKHRGYAFIVFERDSDMKAAYKDADGLRIKDRRILVDVERGRTVKEWRPRRYGGGLGGRHYTKAAPPRPTTYGAPPSGPGGFRGGGGGFRGGGFRGGRGGGGGGGGGGGFRGGFGGDRGGFGGGDRGGFGGGDRGGYGGGRSGVGYGSNAYPEGAPSGPRGGRSGGHGGGYGDRDRDRDSYGGRGGGGGGGSRYGDRPPRDYAGGSGGNREPLGGGGSGGGGGGYRDRDRDYDRKRPHEGGGYDDSRKQRRY